MAERHRWLRPKEHHYLCTKCGTGRVNEQDDGVWTAVWYLPDGTTVQGGPTPACQPGTFTAARLLRYAGAITLMQERRKQQ